MLSTSTKDVSVCPLCGDTGLLDVGFDSLLFELHDFGALVEDFLCETVVILGSLAALTALREGRESDEMLESVLSFRASLCRCSSL